MNKKLLIGGGIILVLVTVGGVMWYRNKNKKSSTVPIPRASSSTTLTTTTLSQDPAVQDMIDRIKADPAWFDSIVAKAKKNKVTLEKQLVDDAKWMLAN